MEFPENLHYSNEHTWLSIDGETGTVGITDFAQSELGEIVYVDLPNVGQTFGENEVFGSVEAIKTVSDLFMPVAGEIIAINREVVTKPSLVTDSPYKEGWLIKIKILALERVGSLQSASDYRTVTGN